MTRLMLSWRVGRLVAAAVLLAAAALLAAGTSADAGDKDKNKSEVKITATGKLGAATPKTATIDVEVQGPKVTITKFDFRAKGE